MPIFLLTTCVAEPIIDHGWYQMQPMIIDLQGPLIAIIQWLKTVSAKTKLVSVPSVSISKIDHVLARCSAMTCGMLVRSIS